MLSKRASRSIALRAFAWLFALAIALGAPQASVLCEASDGHVALERAHVSGVCLDEVLRHGAQRDALADPEAPDCADQLLDRSLGRQADSPDGARAPSSPDAPFALTPVASDATPAYLATLRAEPHELLELARAQRSTVLRL